MRNCIWPADTFVNFEHGLNSGVKRLRQALNDSVGNPRFVETLPRRGYRFIAPVQVVAESEVVSAVQDVPVAVETSDPAGEKDHNQAELSAETELFVLRRRPRPWKVFGLALVVVLAIAVVWRFRSASYPPAAIRSLAVLPLENLSGDASQDYFSDGMTDELITELGQIGQLPVISRTSVMAYKGSHKSLAEIARDLNADAVVEGAVARSRKQVRITAQLILAASEKHLWASSYEGDLNDTFALQQQVARSIATDQIVSPLSVGRLTPVRGYFQVRLPEPATRPFRRSRFRGGRFFPDI